MVIKAVVLSVVICRRLSSLNAGVECMITKLDRFRTLNFLRPQSFKGEFIDL